MPHGEERGRRPRVSNHGPRVQAAPYRPPSSFETFVVAVRRRTLRMRAGWNLRSETPIGRPPMPRSFRQVINAAVAEKRFLVVPGAHDALSARLIEKIGFEAYFIGGFPAVGARYGVPDIGLKGFGEISACVRDIMAAC